MKIKNNLLFAALVATLSQAAVSSLHAADIYWDNLSDSWNNVANWSTVSNATTPDPVAVPGSADTAIFNRTGANAAQIITLDANQSVTGLTFNSTGTSTFRGNIIDVIDRTLTIGSGGITATGGAIEIGNTPATYGAVNIALGADQIWNNGSILTVQGSISGNHQITKNGGQQLRINGTNNSFSGLIMNAGTVFSQTQSNDTFLGSATNAQVTVNGGRLALNRNTIEGTMTLNGGTLDSASGFGSEWNGSTILQSTSTIQGGSGAGTITMNAVISGSGGLTKGTKGTLTLTNANTFTGDTISQVTASSILNLNNSLALQNSTLDTASSGLGTANDGIRTNQTALTLGGLSGDKDVKSLFRTDVTAGGYNSVTALTLNPGTGKTLTYSGGIIDGATGMTLTKTGAGTQTLSGTHTYTGATTVSAGVLVVNGSLANTSTTVQSGGTLQGSGTIGGSVTINGGATLASGNSIESLGVGNLSFLAASTFAYELQTGLYAGTPNVAGDLTFSTGTLDIAAGAILTLTDLATSTALAVGSKLTLISYFGGWAGDELFTYEGDTLVDGGEFTLGANQWRFDYNDTTGGPNFSADQSGATSFVTMTVIPEPSAALLGGLGLLALLRRRRD